MTTSLDHNNSQKLTSFGTNHHNKHLALEDDAKSIQFSGFSSVGLYCCNILVTLCPPPLVHTEDNNMNYYNQLQHDGYRSYMSPTKSFFDFPSQQSAIPLHIFHSIATSTTYLITSTLSLIPEGPIIHLEQLLQQAKINAETKIDSNHGRPPILRTISYRTLDICHRFVSWAHNIVYNSSSSFTSHSHNIIIFETTAVPRTTTQKTITAMCSSLYNTQSVISRTFHTALTWVLDITITLANKSTFVVLDPLQCFPATINQCGYYHLKSRLSHLVFPAHPNWIIYRLGQPFLSFLYNFSHALIPVEDQILLRSTSFLQTSILRAIAVLEIADAVYWYENGYLYGNLIPSSSFALSLNHFISNSTTTLFDVNDHSTWKRGIHINDLAMLTCTNVASLERLLRSSSAFGVFSEIAPQRWINTQLSLILRRPASINASNLNTSPSSSSLSNPPSSNMYSSLNPHQNYKSLAWAVLMFGNEQFVAQSNLADTIENGTPAFSNIYGDLWDYLHTSKEVFLLYKQSMDKNGQKGQKGQTSDIFDTIPLETQLILGSRVAKCSKIQHDIPMLKKMLKNSQKDEKSGKNIKVDKNDILDGKIIPTEHGTITALSSLKTLQAVKNLPFTNVIQKANDQDGQNDQNGQNSLQVVTNNKVPIVSAYLEFNNAMESISITSVNALATDSLYFHDFDTLIDIAGGKGHLIHAILKENLSKYSKYSSRKPSVLKSSNSKKTSSSYSLSEDNEDSFIQKSTVSNIWGHIDNFFTSATASSSSSSSSSSSNFSLPKLTTAVVFDLPYTYENKDTVEEIQSKIHRTLSGFDLTPKALTPKTKVQNFATCFPLHHLPSQHTSVSIPPHYTPQYQTSSFDDEIDQRNGQNGPNSDPDLLSFSHPNDLCTGFTIHTGSFFNSTSLPQSFELNSGVIIAKFTSLIQKSSLFTSFLHYLSPSAYQFTSSIPNSLKYQPTHLSHDGLNVLLSKTLPQITSQFLHNFFIPSITASDSLASSTYENNLPQFNFHVLHQTGYMMMQILHDWNDLDSTTILSNLKTAASTLPPIPPILSQKDLNGNQNNIKKDPKKEQDGKESVNSFHIDLLPSNEREIYATLCYYGVKTHFPLYFTQKHAENDLAAYFTYQLLTSYCHANYHTQSSINYHSERIDHIYTSNHSNQHESTTASSPIPPSSPIVFSLTHNKKILVIDRLLTESPVSIIDDHGGSLADILMMNNFNNARERRISDFSTIFTNAGLMMTRIINTRFMYSIVEGLVVP